MPEDKMTVKDCETHRKDCRDQVFAAMVPRWVFFAAVTVVAGILSIVYWQGVSAAGTARESATATKLLGEKFTLTVEHIKENQQEMKQEQREQRALLQKIDRRLNGGH